MAVLISVEDVKARLGITDDDDSTTLEPAIQAASEAITIWCGQGFVPDTTATARVYAPKSAWRAWVDPFWSTAGLVIKTDDDDDGVFETTWATTSYELVPFGGSMSYVLTAPYDTIRALGGALFPMCGYRTRILEVTAKWGWTVVPASVADAAKIVTVDLWKRKDVAFGIATSTVEFGGLRIGRDVMAQVASLLGPFRRVDRVFGIA